MIAYTRQTAKIIQNKRINRFATFQQIAKYLFSIFFISEKIQYRWLNIFTLVRYISPIDSALFTESWVIKYMYISKAEHRLSMNVFEMLYVLWQHRQSSVQLFSNECWTNTILMQGEFSLCCNYSSYKNWCRRMRWNRNAWLLSISTLFIQSINPLAFDKCFASFSKMSWISALNTNYIVQQSALFTSGINKHLRSFLFVSTSDKIQYNAFCECGLKAKSKKPNNRFFHTLGAWHICEHNKQWGRFIQVKKTPVFLGKIVQSASQSA